MFMLGFVDPKFGSDNRGRDNKRNCVYPGSELKSCLVQENEDCGKADFGVIARS